MMKIPVTDYAYVDEYIIEENVISNCTAPFTRDDILFQIEAYLDGEEESSLVHYLTDDQILDICDKVSSVLLCDGYEVE